VASSCFALCAFVSSLNWRLTSLWHRLDFFFEQRRTPSLQIVVLCSQENRAIQTRSRAINQEARQPHTLLDNRLTSAPWMRRCKQILFELHVSFLMIANSMRHPKPAPQCCGSPRMSASIFLCVSKVFTLNIKGVFSPRGYGIPLWAGYVFHVCEIQAHDVVEEFTESREASRARVVGLACQQTQACFLVLNTHLSARFYDVPLQLQPAHSAPHLSHVRHFFPSV